MEFGSPGLGPQLKSGSNQASAPTPAQSATLETNPGSVVTPAGDGDSARNDRRRDALGQDVTPSSNDNSPSLEISQPTSRRTTLKFDTEQNRVFLEVVDINTDKVIERIPSEQFVKFIDQALDTGDDEVAES